MDFTKMFVLLFGILAIFMARCNAKPGIPIGAIKKGGQWIVSK